MTLGADDKARLLEQARGGDEAARQLLLEDNLNLVRSIVYRFMGRGYEWDDLFQLGCIGMMKAIDRFDASYEVKFSTYAVPMIIGEIRRFLRDDSPVKVSRPVKELAFRVHKAQEALQGELGRDPTVSEVAGYMGITPQEVAEALEAVQAPASLHDPLVKGDGEALLLMDQMKDERAGDGAFIDRIALREGMARLPDRERLVIRLRFFEDRTQAEIAERIGLSQVQISRIEKSALRLMRSYLESS